MEITQPYQDFHNNIESTKEDSKRESKIEDSKCAKSQQETQHKTIGNKSSSNQRDVEIFDFVSIIMVTFGRSYSNISHTLCI